MTVALFKLPKIILYHTYLPFIENESAVPNQHTAFPCFHK